MNKKLKKQLEIAFYAPEPVGKKAFLNNFRLREITTTQLVVQQVAYIRKFVWSFAAVVLIVAIAGTVFMNENTERMVQSLAPLSAASAAAEVHRSFKFKMNELEMATRFSLKSVFYARMLIIGLVYAVIICIVAPVLAVRFDGNAISSVSGILIPYLITTTLCLRVERSVAGRNNANISMAIAAILSAGIFWFSSYDMSVIAYFIAEWGWAVIILLILITIYENHKTMKMLEVCE